MPRSPRLRESANSQSNEARRVWLKTWKRWAANELPGNAPRALRVQLRAAVERALSRFHPDDDDVEVRDVVTDLVEEARRRFHTQTDHTREAESKREVLAGAGQLLDAVLDQSPKEEVTAMLKRPAYSRPVLTGRLRRFLTRHLTGTESPEEIAQLVVAWVERRLDEQPDPPGRMSAASHIAISVAVAGAVIALRSPELKERALETLAKVRDTAWTWLQKLTPPAEPPKS